MKKKKYLSGRGATAGKAPKAWALPRFWVSIRSYKKQPVEKIWSRILGLASNLPWRAPGHLGRGACTLNLISAHTSQEGIECTIAGHSRKLSLTVLIYTYCDLSQATLYVFCAREIKSSALKRSCNVVAIWSSLHIATFLSL